MAALRADRGAEVFPDSQSAARAQAVPRSRFRNTSTSISMSCAHGAGSDAAARAQLPLEFVLQTRQRAALQVRAHLWLDDEPGRRAGQLRSAELIWNYLTHYDPAIDGDRKPGQMARDADGMRAEFLPRLHRADQESPTRPTPASAHRSRDQSGFLQSHPTRRRRGNRKGNLRARPAATTTSRARFFPAVPGDAGSEAGPAPGRVHQAGDAAANREPAARGCRRRYQNFEIRAIFEGKSRKFGPEHGAGRVPPLRR